MRESLKGFNSFENVKSLNPGDALPTHIITITIIQGVALIGAFFFKKKMAVSVA